MENKYFKASHQGPSWSHFRGRDIHKKKLVNSNLQNENNIAEKKEKKTPFSWIMDYCRFKCRIDIMDLQTFI